MIEASRQPINRQAAQQLSKGTTRFNTLEQGLAAAYEFLIKPQNLQKVRSSMENSRSTEMRIKVYKSKTTPGYKIQVKYSEKTFDYDLASWTDLQ